MKSGPRTSASPAAAFERACSTLRAPGMTVDTPGCCQTHAIATWAGEFTTLVQDVVGQDLTPAQVAIAWVWQQPGVSTVIPGARSVEQARANAAAGSADVLGPLFTSGVREIYDEHLRAKIHDRW